MLAFYWVFVFRNRFIKVKNRFTHTNAPSGILDLAKVWLCKLHSCISKPTGTSFICWCKNNSNGCSRHESMRISLVWTHEGLLKEKEVKRRKVKPINNVQLCVKQCGRHSTENNKGNKFLFLIEYPHMTLKGLENTFISRTFQVFIALSLRWQLLNLKCSHRNICFCDQEIVFVVLVFPL